MDFRTAELNSRIWYHLWETIYPSDKSKEWPRKDGIQLSLKLVIGVRTRNASSSSELPELPQWCIDDVLTPRCNAGESLLPRHWHWHQLSEHRSSLPISQNATGRSRSMDRYRNRNRFHCTWCNNFLFHFQALSLSPNPTFVKTKRSALNDSELMDLMVRMSFLCYEVISLENVLDSYLSSDILFSYQI
jgi:hypothetical protein